MFKFTAILAISTIAISGCVGLSTTSNRGQTPVSPSPRVAEQSPLMAEQSTSALISDREWELLEDEVLREMPRASRESIRPVVEQWCSYSPEEAFTAADLEMQQDAEWYNLTIAAIGFKRACTQNRAGMDHALDKLETPENEDEIYRLLKLMHR